MAVSGAQLAAGVLLMGTAALTGTGLWYLSTGRLVPVNEETESSYGDNSIGKKYGKYFLSSKNNQKEWERRFNVYKDKFQTVATPASNTSSEKIKDKFKTAEHGFGEDVSKSLNKLCDAVYQLTSATDLVDIDTENKYMKSHIWKFCGLYEVVTVDEDKTNYSTTDFPSTKIGGDNTNKKLFVSAKDDKNDWFWKIRFEEFKSGEGNIQVTGTDANNNFFKKLTDNDQKSWDKLRDACHDAYTKETNSDTSNKNKEDALLFCSIKLDVGTASAG